MAITYGGNNRTQMMRIARSGAIEDRTPDFSGSPYLGFTAALAAGMDGVTRKLDPGEPNDMDLYCTVARNQTPWHPDAAALVDGIGALPGPRPKCCVKLSARVPVSGLYGEPSDDTEAFVDYYARIKREEYHDVTWTVVTSHEISRYLRFPATSSATVLILGT